MIRDTGVLKIEEVDCANVPVACMIEEPVGPHGLWVWTAVNYMPRKGLLCCRLQT